ncbi:hypothetical protein [Paenibacillus medicaginis]|uniref:Uncharacterized protein n=1 Tax=Paenibacillus medicaginis TaxID=1470560 RepID=A0ABV5BUP3_9BACL
MKINNKVSNTEVKEIVYHQSHQKFTETSNFTEYTKSDSFRIPERKQKVIHTKDETIVILDDGSKGVAKCSNKDNYNKLTGLKIAYIRAKIKSMEKELQELFK